MDKLNSLNSWQIFKFNKYSSAKYNLRSWSGPLSPIIESTVTERIVKIVVMRYSWLAIWHKKCQLQNVYIISLIQTV